MQLAKLGACLVVFGFCLIGAAHSQQSSPHPDSRECVTARRQDLGRAIELGCLRDVESAYTLGLLDGVEMTQQNQPAARPSPEQTLAEIDAREAQRQLRAVRDCISRAQAYVFNPTLAQTLYSSLARCERLAEGQNF